MTIAACYVSAEGVVFGADSTSTMYVSGLGPGAAGAEHQYNFAQKIFQVGENSTLGIVMWGLGGLPNISYRTLVAQFADSLIGHGIQSVEELAHRWQNLFWTEYYNRLQPVLERARSLQNLPTRSDAEMRDLADLRQLFSGGFCLGGHLMHDRSPSAFQILYDPILLQPGPIERIAVGRARFWGCPNLLDRMIYGLDEGVFAGIIKSGKWSGTEQELFDLLVPHCLGQPSDLPIREAIDWVHASIYTTIKTMKFSHLAPVCGGPVEVAVITTDRKFRWVRHKGFDAAIGEGGLFDVYREPR